MQLIIDLLIIRHMGRTRITEDFEPNKMGVNPFIDALRVVTTEYKEVKELFEAKSETDGVFVQVGERREYLFELEVQRYTKVYQDAKSRKMLGAMGTAAKVLMWWIMLELKSGKDYVIINIDRYKEENGVCHKTYKTGINRLVDVGVLAKTKYANIYWINPQYLFCGNRIKKFPDNVLKIQKKQTN